MTQFRIKEFIVCHVFLKTENIQLNASFQATVCQSSIIRDE
jgi:hypothetical protein